MESQTRKISYANKESNNYADQDLFRISQSSYFSTLLTIIQDFGQKTFSERVQAVQH